jgi:hypothetical protein
MNGGKGAHRHVASLCCMLADGRAQSLGVCKREPNAKPIGRKACERRERRWLNNNSSHSAVEKIRHDLGVGAPLDDGAPHTALQSAAKSEPIWQSADTRW